MPKAFKKEELVNQPLPEVKNVLNVREPKVRKPPYKAPTIPWSAKLAKLSKQLGLNLKLDALGIKMAPEDDPLQVFLGVLHAACYHAERPITTKELAEIGVDRIQLRKMVAAGCLNTYAMRHNRTGQAVMGYTVVTVKEGSDVRNSGQEDGDGQAG